MGKVVTSQGLQEFVSSGKFETVPNHKPAKVEVAAEVKPEAKVEPVKDETQKNGKTEEPAEAAAIEPASEDEGLEDGDREFPDRVRKRINAKHKAMKEAQESAAENERLAETLYNQRVLADKRAEAAEARAKALEEQTTKKAAEPELKEPIETDPKYQVNGQFDWKTYSKDVSKFEAAQAVAAERQKNADERAAAEADKVRERTIKGANESRKLHADFDEVLTSVKGTSADQVPQYVLDYMHDRAELAGELAYYLAKNPDERDRIAALTPRLGTAELGKLELKLKPTQAEKQPDKPTLSATITPIRQERGAAPAPITPLNGEGVSGVVTDPAKMDFKQLRAYERARAKRH
jgi:hypothetical protein